MSTKYDLSNPAFRRPPAAGLFGSAKPCADLHDDIMVTDALTKRFADNFRAGTHVAATHVGGAGSRSTD